MIYNFTVCNYSRKIREKNLREYNYILFTLAQKKSNVEIIINIYYQNAIKPILLYINITNSINITHLKRWGLFWKNYFQWFILANGNTLQWNHFYSWQPKFRRIQSFNKP